MPALLNHVWILGVLVMAVNLVIGRVRMRALIAKGAMTAAQANRFCWVAGAILVVTGAVFELVTWLWGVPAPCQFSLPLADSRVLPNYGLTVVLGGSLLYWVWRRGGDRTLALVAPAFSRGGVTEKTYTPRQVRLWLTVLLLVAWGGYVVMRLSMPTPPPFPGCPV